MIDEEKLIPELKSWKKENGDDFDISDWTRCEGNIQLAIGYSFMFWPNFIEHEGCVFIESRFSVDSFETWKKIESIEYYSQIESVLNHFHILDLFVWEQQNESSKNQVLYLGKKLLEIYKTKLKADFPNYLFDISFNDNIETNELIDYQLVFHRIENEQRKIR
ncbi:hypothetical protein [Spirochaeta cellobiosiphila]|uniref:hypothetical protein n=1 Tax=Spirochaeta cellobiosiphila TaxID=504483 RepID=UPI000424D77D|nr:hypothetical protein [Spirochaeta cellobiosiphila]